MWDSNCFVYGSGRHHDERENRFIRQIKFNFPNALAGKNLERRNPLRVDQMEIV